MPNSMRIAMMTWILLFGSVAVSAQTSVLYVTDGDSARLAIVQGGVLLDLKTTHVRGYPLTVTSSLWIGDYNGAQPDAIEYDLAGDATGNTVAYSAINAVDGTTDGVSSWQLASAFGATGEVYFSPSVDFQGATFAFNAPGSDVVGISFDSASDTLWVSDETNVYNYSTAGALLGQFAHSSGRGCIAYEASSDTLWYVTNNSDNITQYSKAGALLQTLTVTGLSSNNWGCEFGSAPQETPPSVLEIPTLSTWGMLVLVLSLAAGALAVQRRFLFQ